jgi:nucleotide-binding universal stress UspA family protein
VCARAVPGWVRRWAAGSDRAVQALPDGAPALASDAGTIVLPGAGTEPVARPRVVAVLRDLVDDLPVLAESADVAAHLDGSLRVLHGVPLSFGERSVGIDEALRRGRLLLAAARTWLEVSGCTVPVSTELVRAWPHELVDEHLAADLLTVGGPRRESGARIGLVTSSAIHHAPCPVLLAARTVDLPAHVRDGPAPEGRVPLVAP